MCLYIDGDLLKTMKEKIDLTYVTLSKLFLKLFHGLCSKVVNFINWSICLRHKNYATMCVNFMIVCAMYTVDNANKRTATNAEYETVCLLWFILQSKRNV